MTIKKKCIIVTDNDELYLSFRRAIRVHCGLDVIKFDGKYGDKNSVVLLFEESNFESWLWGEFRGRKSALNPLVLLGTEDEASFKQRNAVFKPYSAEHTYLRIPFDLKQLVQVIEEMKPIFDQVTRKIIVNNFAKEYEWKLITHDLKIIAGDKDSSIRNIMKAQEYYASINDMTAINCIKDGLESIDPDSDWERCLLDIKEDLVRRYKGK